jgi:hypothetical protein
MAAINLAIEKNATNSKIQDYKCVNCDKKYKVYSGLWRHNKKCFIQKEEKGNGEMEETEKTEEKENKSQHEIILLLLKENQEFKQMLMENYKQTSELQKQVIDLATKTNITTTNNNCNNTTNKFNMNIFLNETCKDAMNIMDFVTSLPLSLQDLEETGKQGYVKGLSRILVNGLKDIDVSKRPIHCSDLKRETIYIKDNNVWEKDDNDKNKIKNAIKYISLKNAKQITQWTKVKENEGYRDSYNKKSDQYLKLVYEANGGDEDELNKIIKNISANVVIDKNQGIL